MKPQLIFIIGFLFTLKNVKAQNFDKLRGSVTNKELRTFIKLNVLLERTPMAVANDLALILPDTHMSKTQVYTWYDLPRPGRPRETTDEAHKEWVKELILESEVMTTQDLIYETDIPETSLRRLLKEIGA